MARAQVNGQPVKHSLLLRNIKLLVEVIVTKKLMECLFKELGQCDCDTECKPDVMTDEEVDFELFEKEMAKD